MQILEKVRVIVGDNNDSAQINQQESYLALRILNELCCMNLRFSHAQILSLLKRPANIEITKNFFHFITFSLNSYITCLDDLIVKAADEKAQLKILKKEKEATLI